MVECICINDANRPKQIPVNKWVKEGDLYNVIYTVRVLPQNKIGVHLQEIDLDESCMPYEYFLLNRFAFTLSGLEKLQQLIKDCTDTDFSLKKLMEQTELQEV